MMRNGATVVQRKSAMKSLKHNAKSKKANKNAIAELDLSEYEIINSNGETDDAGDWTDDEPQTSSASKSKPVTKPKSQEDTKAKKNTQTENSTKTEAEPKSKEVTQDTETKTTKSIFGSIGSWISSMSSTESLNEQEPSYLELEPEDIISDEEQLLEEENRNEEHNEDLENNINALYTELATMAIVEFIMGLRIVNYIRMWVLSCGVWIQHNFSIEPSASPSRMDRILMCLQGHDKIAHGLGLAALTYGTIKQMLLLIFLIMFNSSLNDDFKKYTQMINGMHIYSFIETCILVQFVFKIKAQTTDKLNFNNNRPLRENPYFKRERLNNRELTIFNKIGFILAPSILEPRMPPTTANDKIIRFFIRNKIIGYIFILAVILIQVSHTNCVVEFLFKHPILITEWTSFISLAYSFTFLTELIITLGILYLICDLFITISIGIPAGEDDNDENNDENNVENNVENNDRDN